MDTDKRTKCNKLKGYIQGTFDFALLRKTTFLLFCINGVLQKFILFCYVPHTVNWVFAAVGSRQLAIWAASSLSFTTTSSRILIASIADCKGVSRLVIYGCGLLFAFLSCIPPLAFPGIIGSYCSVVSFGIHTGLFL